MTYMFMVFLIIMRDNLNRYKNQIKLGEDGAE